MKLLKIAIDPGQAGAIAVQYPEGETIATPFEDEGTMRDLLKEVKEQANANEDVQIQAVLERVRSMPGQGVASMFKFGQNYGTGGASSRVWKSPSTKSHPRNGRQGCTLPPPYRVPSAKRHSNK